MLNLRATLLRLCDMSLPMLTDLKAWAKRSANLSDFDAENCSSPSLRIGIATNEHGEAVCYCPLEKIYMVQGYAVNPNATPSEAKTAGDYLDAAIADAAQREGVTRLLLIVPDSVPHMSEEKWIRVLERKIAPTANNHLGCSAPSQATQYVN